MHGPQFNQPRQIHVRDVDETAVCAMTAGSAKAVRNKFDGNEDALAVYDVARKGQLLLAADSHFGSAASSFVLEQFPVVFEATKGSIDRRIFGTHLTLDRETWRHKLQLHDVDPHCSTTLLSVFVQGNRLHYASTGDSILYLYRRGKLLQINGTRDGQFIGEPETHLNRSTEVIEAYIPKQIMNNMDTLYDYLFGLVHIQFYTRTQNLSEQQKKRILDIMREKIGAPVPLSAEDLVTPWHPVQIHLARHLPEWGRFSVRPGDLIILATDGILENVSGCSHDRLEQIMADESSSGLGAMAQAILEACLGKRGGRDNTSILIKEITRSCDQSHR